MAEDQGKKEEEKFEFDSAGEALGYISLDQARVLAMRTAGEAPGEYGRRFRNVTMAFEVVEDNETEDYYMVTLSVRPQSRFTGAPGQEQFFIEKEGIIAHRQVLSLPRPQGGRRFPVIPVAVGLVAVAILAVVGVVLAAGGDGGDGPSAGLVPTSTPTPTLIQVPASPTAVPLVLVATPVTTPTPIPTPTPVQTPGITPEPTLAIAPPPTATPTAVPIPTATPTPVPIPEATPRPTQEAPPSASVVRELGISDGVHYGTAAILGPFDLGSGTQFFSVAVPPFQGYFYGNTDFADPPVFFADVVGPPSACDMLNYPGYKGLLSPQEVRNAAALTFTTIDTVLFGTQKSECYQGMLVFRQGNQYGIIDPIEMDTDGTLHINWWLGEPDLVDFSVAPATIPTTTPTPTPTSTPIPTATPRATATPVTTLTPAPTPTPTPGINAAPDFEFTLFRGEEVLGTSISRLSDLRGKPVVLNFWGGLLPPSRAEMPELQAFYQEFEDQVSLLGIDIGAFVGLGSQQDAQNLLRELNITYPAGFTDDSSVVRRYEVLGLPTTVFITADGNIFRTWSGALNHDVLISVVQEMLQSATPTPFLLNISVDGDALAFDTSNFKVPAGAEVVLVFDNVSTINQHNWVLVKPGTKDDVAGRGVAAGPANSWIQAGDQDVIAHTSLLDPGTSGEVRFTAPPAGTYQFVCTFPGHNLTLFGDFVVTSSSATSGKTATVTVTPTEPVAVAIAPAPTVAPTPMVVTTGANIQDFTHQDLTLQTGTTVVWTNRDAVSHTTTARAGQWDSGTLRERESFSFTFTEAGVFSYFCAIHPSMTATVTVTPAQPVAVAPTPTPSLLTADGGTFKQYAQPPLMTIDPAASYTAIISTNKGDLTLELFASEAPFTVNNFVFLAREGFYDGVIFHRVIRDFMIQTGDPTGTGTGGPGYRFDDEPVTRSYSQGIVAMANSGPNTNGSQFFIVHGTDVSLSPTFTIFGQVILGMDTVDELANTPVGPSARGELSVPTETLRIQSIEINTNGLR